MRWRIVLLLSLLAVRVGPLRAQEVASAAELLLSRGDTAGAIAALRDGGRGATPGQQCLLATLLTHQATTATATWRLRAEAEELFNTALYKAPTPGCHLAFALLREKQGARIEAERELRRAEALVRDQPVVDTVQLAELLYRRGVLLDDWLRNFDYLVNAVQLPVSTPACIYYGYFCENFTRAASFNARLAAAPSVAGSAAEERALTVQVLDSVLTLQPRHQDARRVRLRRALVAGTWDEFERIAQAGVAADTTSVVSWLGVLAAQAQRGAYRDAAATLARIDALIPDTARAGFERLAAVTSQVVADRADAIWRVSDPLYLTSENERRIQHYARIALADIAFTDPGLNLAGRDTQPGRLVLRYGWPKAIWEVRRDGSQELDPENMRNVFEYLATGGGARLISSASPQSSGRWTFFNYDPRMPSFVFERSLSERTYRYKLVTLTEQLDSTLARAAPSTFESPYALGEVAALFTRFPRPAQPVLEVGARFRWTAAGDRHDSVRVGVFVHERVAGGLVNRGVSRHTARDSVRFAAALPVVWGPLQVSVEGLTATPSVAGSARTNIVLARPDSGLVLSDLLLGETLEAPDAADRRANVHIRLRVDSLPAPDQPLALYWETYGLIPDSTGITRYTVTLRVDDIAGGRSPGAAVVRVLGNLITSGPDAALTWTRERPGLEAYTPEFVVLRTPGSAGSYRLTVDVSDRVGGTTARTSRTVTVRPPPPPP